MSEHALAAASAMPLVREASIGSSGGAGTSPSPAAARKLRERLAATFGRRQEALSPRALRKVLEQLQAIVDPRLSEVEAGRRAEAFGAWYAAAPAAQRRDSWALMAECFAPDASKLQAARAQYEAALGTPEEGAGEIRLRRAFASPRTRLLQRFAAYEGGMRFLVDLRAELLGHLKHDKSLMPLDAELESLFSTWLDVGFLELRRISWDSPASLIEKLIKYEAVHDIKSWADVKNRLDSDRRCYGFFHPKLPDEPLIFVEVALLGDMASSVAPLLDEAGAAADLTRANVASFYSISNTQAGLRGVSFGDSLIKHVVETLKLDFPKLKTFATLSPIPGLRAWLTRHVPAALLAQWDEPAQLGPKSAARTQLLAWSARYLAREMHEGKPLDAVARFHLGNGARVERMNWAGDLSPKGLKQSYGLMVNYLYDLRRLDKHRTMLAAGKVPVSSQVEDLMR